MNYFPDALLIAVNVNFFQFSFQTFKINNISWVHFTILFFCLFVLFCSIPLWLELFFSQPTLTCLQTPQWVGGNAWTALTNVTVLLSLVVIFQSSSYMVFQQLLVLLTAPCFWSMIFLNFWFWLSSYFIWCPFSVFFAT